MRKNSFSFDLTDYRLDWMIVTLDRENVFLKTSQGQGLR